MTVYKYIFEIYTKNEDIEFVMVIAEDIKKAKEQLSEYSNFDVLIQVNKFPADLGDLTQSQYQAYVSYLVGDSTNELLSEAKETTLPKDTKTALGKTKTENDKATKAALKAVEDNQKNTLGKEEKDFKPNKYETPTLEDELENITYYSGGMEDLNYSGGMSEKFKERALKGLTGEDGKQNKIFNDRAKYRHKLQTATIEMQGNYPVGKQDGKRSQMYTESELNAIAKIIKEELANVGLFADEHGNNYNIEESTNKIKQKGDLPNKEGFKFIAVYPNGTEKTQEVKKDSKGLHYIDNFKEISGWKNMIEEGKSFDKSKAEYGVKKDDFKKKQKEMKSKREVKQLTESEYNGIEYYILHKPSVNAELGEKDWEEYTLVLGDGKIRNINNLYTDNPNEEKGVDEDGVAWYDNYTVENYGFKTTEEYVDFATKDGEIEMTLDEVPNYVKENALSILSNYNGTQEVEETILPNETEITEELEYIDDEDTFVEDYQAAPEDVKKLIVHYGEKIENFPDRMFQILKGLDDALFDFDYTIVWDKTGEITALKQIGSETELTEGGVHKDGQVDMFANQREVNKLEKQQTKLDKERNPTPKMISSAWNNFTDWTFWGKLKECGWVSIGSVKNNSFIGEQLEKERKDACDIKELVAILRKDFKYPNQLVSGVSRSQYAPEIKKALLGVNLISKPVVKEKEPWMESKEEITEELDQNEINKVIDTVGSDNEVVVSKDDEGKEKVEIKKKKEMNESTIKQITFKDFEIKDLKHAKSLIPESYKTDGNIFNLSDGNKTFTFKWEKQGFINEASLINKEDKKLLKENREKMEKLFNYKSPVSTLSDKQKKSEDSVFKNLYNKVNE